MQSPLVEPGTEPTAVPGPSAEPQAEDRRRHPLWLALMACVLIIVATILWLAFVPLFSEFLICAALLCRLHSHHFAGSAMMRSRFFGSCAGLSALSCLTVLAVKCC